MQQGVGREDYSCRGCTGGNTSRLKPSGMSPTCWWLWSHCTEASVLLYQKKRGQRELERKNEREKKREDGVFIHPSQKANRGGGGYCLGTPLDGVKGQKFKDSLCWYQQMSYATVSASETKQNKIFPSFSAPGSASRTSFCVCVYIMCIYHILIFHIYIIYCLNICLDIR